MKTTEIDKYLGKTVTVLVSKLENIISDGFGILGFNNDTFMYMIKNDNHIFANFYSWEIDSIELYRGEIIFWIYVKVYEDDSNA